MKVIDRKLVEEDIRELKKLQKTVKHRRFVPRIQMLILLKENPKMTLKEVANLLNYGYKTVKTWWRNYKEGGLEKLLEWKVEGFKGRLKDEQVKKIEEEINNREFRTQKEIADWIEKEFGVKYTQQGISRLLKKLKIKKKVGRPVNINKQEEKSKEFKENVLKQIVEENKDKDIFFDESRFGLITDISRVWKGFGIKPIVKTQLKFKYTYLYKAVNPKTGESFSLIMPSINTDNLNKFLEEFKEFLGDKEVVLIMDNASFHKSKRLKIPKGISIEYIPPYSPELNPIERVFQEIKKHFKNLIFDNIDEMIEKLSEVLNTFSMEKLKNLTFFPYIKNALLG